MESPKVSRLGACRTYNLTHGVGQVKRNFLHRIALLLVNPPENGNHIFRPCTCHDGYQGLFTYTCVTVSYERV